jgi:hypothetical protein
MAVVVGQYFVASNPSLRELSDYALGLDIPMQMGTNTFFQNYDSIAQLKANVTFLLTNPFLVQSYIRFFLNQMMMN